jgi:peptidoglycan/xylan/chitin deacetylase (PgdA/CDA1 family)
MLYPTLQWQVKTKEKNLYLTFDDGPHETATPFVLDTLQCFNAKATFFCIGKNVTTNKEIYNRIINEGHSVGNHTENHLNGWKNSSGDYIENIRMASEKIDSPLFRPPYGRIKRTQIDALGSANNLPNKIIMWSVLSGDFDTTISGEDCFKNVLKHAKAGSIIVFHDSAKANERLKYALPQTLGHFAKMGYAFKAL